ncbi:MAG TPA: MFS transporter [Acidimicrobiia bacterium]|nr:MFS transporter [Acidimicrobiia bacterium]
MATAPAPRHRPPGPADHRFAEPTPFARLAITHAASICGDVCLTVSLAGSLFFSVSPGESREKVLLYLLLTMAPFAIIAPLLSPLLDRIRGGRRLMIFATCAARALLCLFMARYVNAGGAEGLLIFPLAFGVLVMAKTYSIARSSLVPAVVSGEKELVSANSRLAIISVIGGAVGGLPAAGVYKLFGPEWSLVLAALVFVLASMLSWQIPRVEREHAGPDTPLEKEELHAPSIVLAGSAMGLLRGAVGFLTFFLAFGLRANDEAPWVFGLVLVVSGIGGFLGNVVAPQLRKITREEVILAGSLVIPAIGCLFAARSASLTMISFGGLLIAAGAAAGRVAFDSLLQRDAPDAVRGRSFARFETRFQITWVAGALIPVAIPPVYEDLRVGLLVLAVGVGFAGLSYIAGMRAAREAVDRRRRRMERTRETVERGLRAGLARLRHPGRRARSGRTPAEGTGEIEAGS